MKCIIHIGTEKTGTTSLQKYFSRHYDEMLKRGLWYPKSLGSHWHRDLAVYAMPFSRRDDAFDVLNIFSEDDHIIFKAQLEKKFINELLINKTASYCFISSEHFHSRLKKLDEIQSVYNFLSPYFSEFKIIVHLRPQVDLLVSLASTVARGRSIVDSRFFTNNANLNSMYFDYNLLLSAWSEIFGIENIFPVPFKRIPGMVNYISDMIGINFSDLGDPGRENGALDVEVISLLNSVKKSGVDVRNFGGVINDLPFRNGIQLDRHLSNIIQSKFISSNKMVTDKFSFIRDEDLNINLSLCPDVGNIHILDAPCLFLNSLGDFFERSRKIFMNNKDLRTRLMD